MVHKFMKKFVPVAAIFLVLGLLISIIILRSIDLGGQKDALSLIETQEAQIEPLPTPTETPQVEKEFIPPLIPEKVVFEVRISDREVNQGMEFGSLPAVKYYGYFSFSLDENGDVIVYKLTDPEKPELVGRLEKMEGWIKVVSSWQPTYSKVLSAKEDDITVCLMGETISGPCYALRWNGEWQIQASG